MTYDAHPDRTAKRRLPAQPASPPLLSPTVPDDVLAEVSAAGLPPLGTIITGEGGLQFEVTGYWRREPDHWVERRLALERGAVEHPSEDRFGILPFEAVYSEPMPGEDLFPFIRPINASPRLLSMIEDVDVCSPKDLIFADLCSSAPGRMRYTWRNQIDHVTNPWSIDVMVDASSVDETVLAHELGHAFIDLIFGIEDHRTYWDSTDRPACFQVSSVQSTILDLTVNEVLKLRGFDLGSIAEHVCDNTYYYAQAMHAGFKPPNDYETSWIALGHASALVAPQLYEFTPDQEHRIALDNRVFSEVAPKIADYLGDCATPSWTLAGEVQSRFN
jgi:hypothetical protein